MEEGQDEGQEEGGKKRVIASVLFVCIGVANSLTVHIFQSHVLKRKLKPLSVVIKLVGKTTISSPYRPKLTSYSLSILLAK
jgi:hypothetical protein